MSTPLQYIRSQLFCDIFQSIFSRCLNRVNNFIKDIALKNKYMLNFQYTRIKSNGQSIADGYANVQ